MRSEEDVILIITYFVITKASVAAEGSRNVHATEEGPFLAGRWGIVGLEKVTLDILMVAFIDNIIQAISLCHHIDLQEKITQYLER